MLQIGTTGRETGCWVQREILLRVLLQGAKVLYCLAICVICPAVNSQSAGPHPAAYHFDVVSIHPESEYTGRWKLQFQGDRFEAQGQTAKMLIQYAFHLEDSQIKGLPSWAGDSRFTIVATIDPDTLARIGRVAPSMEEDIHRALVKEVLITRFGFVDHEGGQEQQVDVLEIAKGGPKLGIPHIGQRSDSYAGERDSGSTDAPQLRVLPGGEIHAHRIPLSILAGLLSTEVGGPVRNDTGLSGEYNFDLIWDSQGDSIVKHLTRGAPDIQHRSAAPTNTSDFRPQLKDALREQLGLELTTRPGSLKTLIIDQILRPTPN